MANNCWNEIGVMGDHSCPQLKTFIHCRNCTVYSEAGRGLLDREVPLGYIDEWTELFAHAKIAPTEFQLESTTEETEKSISVLVFRLGVEWLALPAKLFIEITPPCIIHSIPHRSNKILQGIVNIRGEILLCISLSNFLNLETKESQNNKSKSQIAKKDLSQFVQQRMIVVEKEGNRWVFTADEVSNLQRFYSHEFRQAPSVISQADDAYTKSVISWQGKKINFLDDELLFYTINRKLM